MRFEKPVPVKWIAQFLNAQLVGNENGMATGINEIHKVEEGDLVFVDHPKYYEACISSAASFIIINKQTHFPSNKALLITDDPFGAYIKLVDHFRPFEPSMSMKSNSASVGEGTTVFPNVYIGNHVSIGRNCVLYPGVVIMDHCTIGDHVVIQSGTVIGSDAFYYNKKTDRSIHYNRMKSCGKVVIGNNVEIGAGCTVDRGVTAETIIGDGTKIDNLVHLGHDTVIGKNCLIAAQVGIAGAVTLEDNVILWGQVGVNKTLTIGKGAVVNGKSGIMSTLEGGKTYLGIPAMESRQKLRQEVWLRKLPDLLEKVLGNSIR